MKGPVGKYTSPVEHMEIKVERLYLTHTVDGNQKSQGQPPVGCIKSSKIAGSFTILLMEEILHHLGWLKPYE